MTVNLNLQAAYNRVLLINIFSKSEKSNKKILARGVFFYMLTF